MKLSSALFILLFPCFFIGKTKAQPSSFICDSALLVCEGLAGFTGALGTDDIPHAFPGCPSNVLSNPFWLAFVAGSTTISLLVTPSNCEGTNGQFGMQGGIYAGCGGPLVAAQCQCTTDPFELTFNDFKPGEIYYLVLDGCAGDVCDFQISVTLGSTVAISPQQPGLVGAFESCPGSTDEYFAPPGSMGELSYQWSLFPPIGTVSGGDASSVQVTWQQEGFAELCVSTDNGCFSSLPVCLVVSVEINPDLLSLAGDTLVCPNVPSSYFPLPGNCLGTNIFWSVAGGGLLSPPDSAAAVVNWQTPGAGEVCLSAVSSFGDTVETCLTVAVQPAFSAWLAASEPAAEPGDNGWIQVCLGDTLFLTGATLAGQDPVQNDTSFQYFWLFSDGYFLEGKTAWRVFDDLGCYEMGLQVAAHDGCEATPFLGQQIRVVGGQASVVVDPPAGICQGEQVVLQAFAEADTLFCALSSEFSDSSGLAIPDGNGSSVTEVLQVNGYAAGAIVTPGFLRKICVNMEHSWMRDLEIRLTCPNGQTAILHNHPGQVGIEVFLGEPFEADEGLPNPIPGIGYDYCWTPDAANGTWIQVANQTSLTTLPPGNYASFQPLSNFTGCPVNGEWTLKVADLWPIDNGFLFSWSIEFAEPASDFFPVNTQVQWQFDSSLVSYSSTVIVAEPETTTTYFLAVSDNFGCEKLLEFPVEVFDENSPACLPCDSLIADAGDDLLLTCDQPTFPSNLIGESSIEGNFMAYQWTLDGVVISETKTAVMTSLGEYVFTATNLASGCTDSDTLQLILNIEVPIAEAGADVELTCENPTVVLDGSASSTGANYSYLWKSENGMVIGTGLTMTVNQPGEYVFCVIDNLNGCSSSDNVLVSDLLGLPPLATFIAHDTCHASTGAACVFSPEPLTFLWNTGDTTACIADLPTGEYSVAVSYFSCETVLDFSIDSVACTAAGESFQQEELAFQILPNPTNGNFTLQFHLPQAADFQVNLLDAAGKKVRSLLAKQRLDAGWQALRFDVSDLARGAYFLEMMAGGKWVGRKLWLE